MKLYNILDSSHVVSFKQALFEGQAPGGGLYMPTEIPRLLDSFFNTMHGCTFQELAFEVAHSLIGEDIPAEKLRAIVREALSFDAPLVNLAPSLYVLELFHGPTFAFKDFGARFMARLMGYFIQQETQEVNILVATSGDTGSAVAHGFYNVPGIRVVILYPKGKVSPLQEKQLTTLGGNIHALEVEGVFDDCQRLAKQALDDVSLREKYHLTSANSINIGRLIPQSFYYFWAVQQLREKGERGPIAVSVPSGNFGNLTAGLLAKKMGLPVDRFIAANNANDTFFQYLQTGVYTSKPSVPTLSNSMDVGAPNNFPRIHALYDGNHEAIRRDVVGYTFSDEATKEVIRRVYQTHGYLMDPHGAVAYLGLEAYQREYLEVMGVFLETAHPAKFLEVVEPLVGPIEIPGPLKVALDKTKQATFMPNDFDTFRNFLREHLSKE